MFYSIVDVLNDYDVKRQICRAGFRGRKFRAAYEYLTGFHFLGGLMSFENFIRESMRRVDRLPFWQKVRSYLTDTHREITKSAQGVK